MLSDRWALVRDVLFGLFAVVLLSTPLWLPLLHLGEPTYQYKRAEVVVNGSGIEYANNEVIPGTPPISEEIGCASGWEIRVCSLERRVLEGERFPSLVFHGNPDNILHPGVYDTRYQYVLLNDTIYEAAYATNTSAPRDDGLYQVELTHEPASPRRALDRISLQAGAPEVPTTIAKAARSGTATAHRYVTVPETTIHVDSGRYYRVYLAESNRSPSSTLEYLEPILFVVAPFAGLVLLHSLSERVKVTYVGDSRNKSQK